MRMITNKNINVNHGDKVAKKKADTIGTLNLGLSLTAKIKYRRELTLHFTLQHSLTVSNALS